MVKVVVRRWWRYGDGLIVKQYRDCCSRWCGGGDAMVTVWEWNSTVTVTCSWCSRGSCSGGWGLSGLQYQDRWESASWQRDFSTTRLTSVIKFFVRTMNAWLWNKERFPVARACVADAMIAFCTLCISERLRHIPSCAIGIVTMNNNVCFLLAWVVLLWSAYAWMRQFAWIA